MQAELVEIMVIFLSFVEVFVVCRGDLESLTSRSPIYDKIVCD